MREGWGLLACVLATGTAAAAPLDGTGDADTGLSFSGHVRSLLVHSETLDAPAGRYTLDANRLRLEWLGQLAPQLAIEIQYDNEVAVGGQAGISQLAQVMQQPRRTWWDLEDVYAQGSRHLAQHRLHRANFTWSSGSLDLRLGRQRIAWGTGRFWSPLDLLNPVSPTALEPGERQGVDALLAEHRPSALAALSLVLAPVRQGRDNTLLRWRDNRVGVDFALTAGQTAAGRLAGIDLAGQWGGAGWRAEWTLTRPSAGGDFSRLLVGGDYAFANTLTLSGELYRDGSGQGDAARYDLAALRAGARQTVARHYAGLYASYELTPLIKWTNWLAFNLDDHSRYVSPRLTWSVRTGLDLSVGIQAFSGRAGTEFGLRKDLVFAQAQWYF